MTTDQTYLGREPRGAASAADLPPAGPGDPDAAAGGRSQAHRGGERRRTAPARPGRTGAGAVRGAVLLVVVTVLVALGGGWAVSAATPPTYSAQAKVLVLPAGDGGSSSGASAAAVAAQTPTWAALAQTPAVLDPALKTSGLDLTSTQVVRDVSATPEAGTSLITIEAQGAGARAAAALASAAAASLVEQIATRSTLGGVAQTAGSVVQEPEIPVGPSSPNLLLNLAVAAAVGLAVALAILIAARALALRRREGAHDQHRDVDDGAAGGGSPAGGSGPTRR